MVQDFAKKKTKAKTSAPRKKSTHNTPPPAPTVSANGGQFRTLAVGILIGAFATFLAHMQQWLPELPKTPNKPVQTSPRQQPAKPQSQQPEFTFYELLKEDEVDVQSVQAYERTLRSPTDDKGLYLVQAGSFRSAKDAEERRVQLLLLDLKSTTQTAKLKDGKVWHRVMLGPVENGKPLQQVQDTLAANQIEYLLSKQP